MGFAYKFQDTCPQGSFRLRGMSIIYEYDAQSKWLKLYHSTEKTCLFEARLDRDTRAAARSFTLLFEKGVQIKALVLSNNKTLNITQILEDDKLSHILDSIYYLSLSASDLNQKKFTKFIRRTSYDFGLKAFTLKRLSCERSDTHYYRARIKSTHDNETVCRANDISSLIKKLSQEIVRDILPLEYAYRDRSSERLLGAATKFALIAQIMDPVFIPHPTSQNSGDINSESATN